jgi:hypothetical protein
VDVKDSSVASLFVKGADTLDGIEELNVAFLKRAEFEDEREVRLLYSSLQSLNVPDFSRSVI